MCDNCLLCSMCSQRIALEKVLDCADHTPVTLSIEERINFNSNRIDKQFEMAATLREIKEFLLDRIVELEKDVEELKKNKIDIFG